MLTTIRSDFFPVSLIKLSMFYRMKAKFLLIGFVLTACRLIQISFTAIGVGKRTHEKYPTFNPGSIEMSCDEVVKLLGVDIDFKLTFDNHKSKLCKKAAQQY